MVDAVTDGQQNQPALHLTATLLTGMCEEKLKPLKLQPDNTGKLRPERFKESVRSPEVLSRCSQDRRHKAEGGEEDPRNVHQGYVTAAIQPSTEDVKY